jgi:hypothetical protein
MTIDHGLVLRNREDNKKKEKAEKLKESRQEFLILKQPTYIGTYFLLK